MSPQILVNLAKVVRVGDTDVEVALLDRTAGQATFGGMAVEDEDEIVGPEVLITPIKEITSSQWRLVKL